MDYIKSTIEGLPQALKIGTYVGAPVLVGTAGGLLTWWFEDALSAQIQEKAWLLPIIGGLATGGLAAFILLK